MRFPTTSAWMLLLVASGVMLPSSAEPCEEPARKVEIQVNDGALSEVPTNGPVVFPVRTEGIALTELESGIRLVVAEQGGMEVTGSFSIEHIQTRYSEPVSETRAGNQRWLVLWMPDSPMSPSSQHQFSFDRSNFDGKPSDVVVEVPGDDFFTTAEGPRDEIQAPSIARLAVERRQASANGDVDCAMASGGACPTCKFTDRSEYVAVSAKLTEDHGRADVVYELKPKSSFQGVTRLAPQWIPSEAAPGGEMTLLWEEGPDEFCARIVARSLIDGATKASDEKCIDAPAASPRPDSEVDSGCGCESAPSPAPLGGLLFGLCGLVILVRQR